MGARLIVEKDALIRNYLKLRETCGVEVIPVLKSNAYGLGLLQAAGIYVELGAKRIAVSRVGEAELLSNYGCEAELILLSSSDLRSDIERAVATGATLAAGSMLSLKLINEAGDKAGKKVKVHLLIDTGFSHSGLRDFEYERAANMLPTLRYVNVAGIFTQFTESHAEKPLFTELQNERFENAVKFFSKNVGTKLLVHAANSCAAVKYPETRYDAVRIGSGLLGRMPAGFDAGLTKIGSLECDVAEVKLIEKGQYVGYSRQFKTKRKTKLALLHIGMSDGLAEGKLPYGRKRISKLKDAVKGLFRAFDDDRIFGRVNGKKVPVVGKISQHCLALDVTDVECEVGDVVRFSANPLFVPAGVERKYV